MEHAHKKLLIVDDDPFIVKAIEYALIQKGFIVVSLPDAEKALIKISEETFDFFLVDLVLPGMNGFEFVKKLRKMPEYLKCPILIITARSDAKDNNSAKLAGADDILIKPFDLESLSERIDSLVKQA